jgi:glycosyltransferase involved in cell wall biosynthesis
VSIIRRRIITAVLLFGGSLIERKGIDDLFNSLARPNNLSWSLNVAGNGDQAPWRRLASQRGIGARVSFLGWLSPAIVRHLLTESDVLVPPAHNEGLPMAILEAMAHGRA